MIVLAKTQFGKDIKAWRMDRGREYSLLQLQELCDEVGSILELTTIYTPEQDGISERSI
jgi:transposase InsO family protein